MTEELKEYRVTWMIEVYAASPRDAAKLARDIQRDRKSLATIFEVQEILSPSCRIDLSDGGRTR